MKGWANLRHLYAALTQKEVAELTGLGLTTIHKFENGTAGNLSLATFLLLLKVVGQIDAINDVLPELPPSPYLMRKDEKKAQRIRHTKQYLVMVNMLGITTVSLMIALP